MATQSIFPTTGRCLAYAQLVRLPNVFTAMADIVLAGVVTGVVVSRFIPFVFVLLASSFFYMAGMIWNDYFDQEQDRKERPFRPLPSGKIQPSAAAGLGLGLMAAGLACVIQADFSRWSPLVCATALVAAIVLYDAWFKKTWLGPIAMGTCRFFNILLGLSLAADGIAAWGVFLALSVGVYIAGVTWFARTEARGSEQNALCAAAGIMAAGLLLSLTVPALAKDAGLNKTTAPLYPYLLVGFAFYLGLPVSRAVANPAPARVQVAVKRCVLGLILFDAILATTLVGTWGLLLALLLAPAIFLGRWVYST